VVALSKKEKLLASAQKSLQKGQVARAIKDYQQLVQIDSTDVRIRQKLAELFGRDRRIEEALGEYETVAKHYTKTGFYLKAIAVYKQMQKLEPTKAEIYLRLAELNEKQGLLGNALAEYRNLVAYYEKHKMLSEAAGVLHKMRELEPDNLNILVKIAETYAKNGLKDKALEEFSAALAVLREKEDFTRVVKLYEIFLPLYPDVSEMKMGLAQALIRKGEAEKGIPILKNLLQETPEQPEIQRMLARGYRETGDYGNERLTYQHLLRHASDDLDLRQGYIQACLDSGEGARAFEELEEWKETFRQAERVSALKGFYEKLSQVFPDDDRVRTSLQFIQEIGGEKPIFQSGISAESKESATPPEAEPLVPGAEDAVDSALDEGLTIPEDASVLTGEPIAQLGLDDDFGDMEEIPLEFLEGVSGIEPEETGSDLVEPERIELQEAEPEETVPDLELELELELDWEEPVVEPAPASEDEGGVLDLDIDDVLPLEEAGGEEVPSVPEGMAEPEEEILDLELDDALSLEGSDDELDLPFAEFVGEPEEEILNLEMTDALPPEESPVLQPADLRAEMEEAEFYLQQGLLEDAERICRCLLEANPGCEEALCKLDEIETRRQGPTGEPAAEQHFDLAGEIVGDILSEFEEGTGVFADSQKGIETAIDVEDTESHYNLGIAYKEMGLLDEAIAEFDKAMNNAGRRLDCLTLKGICLAEKGAFEQGEEALKAGLHHPGLSDDERISLLYEMALLYESWGRLLDALDSFQSVADVDLFYRDVGEKIRSLRKQLGLDDSEDGGESGPTGDKDRVSYV
jgi:tetratricopeptide (TPR) repeat protein